MTCRELFERLSEYLDGELSPDICQEISRHMEGCAPCVNFARTLQKTADLCRPPPTQTLPPDLAASLHTLLTTNRREPK